MLYCVSEADGTYRLEIFREYVCWTGTHIIHATLCIAISILFMSICVIATLSFFDNSLVSTDYGAKVNARAETFDIMVEIILNYVYTFFNSPDYQWLLLSLCLMFSYM